MNPVSVLYQGKINILIKSLYSVSLYSVLPSIPLFLFYHILVLSFFSFFGSSVPSLLYTQSVPTYSLPNFLPVRLFIYTSVFTHSSLLYISCHSLYLTYISSSPFLLPFIINIFPFPTCLSPYHATPFMSHSYAVFLILFLSPSSYDTLPFLIVSPG